MKSHERRAVVAEVVHDVARALTAILRLHRVGPDALADAGRALDKIMEAHLRPPPGHPSLGRRG